MRLVPIARGAAFAALCTTTVVLYALSLLETIGRHPALSLLKGGVLVALLAGCVDEVRALYAARAARATARGAARVAAAGIVSQSTVGEPAVTKYAIGALRASAGQFVAVFLGAVVTFLVSVEFALGAVVGSALVGLVGALLVPKYAVALFCGSFVGMSSPAVFAYLGWVALAGLFAALLFVAAQGVFDGFGGKLGTIAFAGALSASVVVGCRLSGAPVPTGGAAIWILFYSAIAALVTFLLNVRWGHGPVIASALVGLLGGLLLPAAHGPELGQTLAVMVFCSSFAGMSAARRFESVWSMVLIGILCAAAFMLTSPYLGGAGGKLGTIAFGSTIAVHTIDRVARATRQRFVYHVST